MALVSVSCEFKTELKTASDKNTAKPNESKIRNGITLQTGGLKVSQAFLLYEDGALVPETNEAKVGQKIVLRLIVDGGWKEENGKVFPAASEKILTNTGEVVLNNDDLFGPMTEGVATKDAQYITLSAVITRIDKLYDYFVVRFRVWDKKGTADVTGSYKLYIK
jgi:hypothetical protein